LHWRGLVYALEGVGVFALEGVGVFALEGVGVFALEGVGLLVTAHHVGARRTF